MVSESTEEIVRNYIIQHPRCSKSDVVKHMNTIEESKRLSRVPTLNLVNVLETKGIIKVERPERPGKSHRLLVNDVNIFNQLSSWISETEIVSDIVTKNLRSIFVLVEDNYSGESELPKQLKKLMTHLRVSLDVINIMIDILLIEIYSRVKTILDRQRLTIKTVKVLLKTLNYTFSSSPPLSLIEYYRFSDFGITESVKKYGKTRGIETDKLIYLSQKIDAFEKQFIRTKHSGS